jgi:hypothetical protein
MDPSTSADEALIEGIVVMAGWQTHHRTARSAEALMTAGASRFPAPYSNAVFPIEYGSAEALLESGARYFSDRRYILWTRVDRDRTLEEEALRRGFLALGDEPGMVLETRVAPPAPAPGISLELVSTPDALRELIGVCQQGYAEVGLPAEIGAKLFASPDAVLNSGAALGLARENGTPIAAALSLANPATGLGGVYWVATVPAARRKGGAEAVTRLVTNCAFDRGARLVALQATRAGEPIYARLGYREVVRYARFLAPKPAA